MHFQFLIEDRFGRILVQKVMAQLMKRHPQAGITCGYKSFQGIGTIPKRQLGRVENVKTRKLLNDLPIYLRAFQRSLEGLGRRAAIFIVLDNDQNETAVLRQRLAAISKQNDITMDHVYCVAVEEMEAWLLGDHMALLAAYPKARKAVLKSYVQDSICGTWEKLADIVYPGGLAKLKKGSSYREIGEQKCQWAEKIGEKLRLEENESPSFQYFISSIQARIPAAGSES